MPLLLQTDFFLNCYGFFRFHGFIQTPACKVFTLILPSNMRVLTVLFLFFLHFNYWAAQHGGVRQPHGCEVSPGRLSVRFQVEAADHVAAGAGQVHGLRGVRAADAKVCGQAACGRHEEEGVRYPNRRHVPPRWLPFLGQVKD